ncbi:S-adenosylmethionine synthase isoform type-2-like protein, partial [Lates japonicus]
MWSFWIDRRPVRGGLVDQDREGQEQYPLPSLLKLLQALMVTEILSDFVNQTPPTWTMKDARDLQILNPLNLSPLTNELKMNPSSGARSGKTFLFTSESVGEGHS